VAARQLAVARSVADLRRHVAGWRRDGRRIALVPTMGALHDGHLALVAAAKAACERVVVSIFVNPKQFGPNEDFAAYPRGEAADLAKLREAEADLAFVPTGAEMYPPGFATTVRIAGLSEGLCGAHRPGHFDGVATVVTKLLTQCLPDIACFGEKDYQQLLVVRRLARDLDLAVEIRGVPTVREPDGLALSSRNAYLSAEERRIAPNLARVLRAVAAALAVHPDHIADEIARGIAELTHAGLTVEYLEIRDAETLAPLGDRITRPARVLAAVHLGKTRLIDNMPVAPARR
jgi:pantoate--beta-alanine ligase